MLDRSARVRIFCILGAIGSGKSTLARILGEAHPVFDADKLAAAALAAKHDALLERFGAEVLLDGALNKGFLAEKIFNCDDERKWISDLISADVVSEIRRRAALSGKSIAFAEITAPTSEIVAAFDGVIYVEAGLEAALARTDDRENGWSRARREKIYRMQERDISDALNEYRGIILKIDNKYGAEELRKSAAEILQVIVRSIKYEEK